MSFSNQIKVYAPRHEKITSVTIKDHKSEIENHKRDNKKITNVTIDNRRRDGFGNRSNLDWFDISNLAVKALVCKAISES